MKKTSILIVTILLTVATQAQFTASLRGGVIQNISNTFFAPALNFTVANFTYSAEAVVQTSRDQPVNFGLRASYQFHFIEAGLGGYYSFYSTDAYDKLKNGWRNTYFVAFHYKNLFVEYEYLNNLKRKLQAAQVNHGISIGVRKVFDNY